MLDADGGLVSHRIVIRFAVKVETASTLSLRFAVDRGPIPDLELVFDGVHRGVFHSRVVRDDRSETGEPGPIAGSVHLEIGLPAKWLAVGEHTVSIATVIDKAAALGEHAGVTHDVMQRPNEQLPPARSFYGNWFGAYLRWESVRLSAGRREPTVGMVVRPTPLFVPKRHSIGALSHPAD